MADFAAKVHIRKAVANDAKAAYRLIRETLEGSYLPFTVYQDPRSMLYLEERIPNSAGCFSVAVSEGGDIVGYAQSGLLEQTWFLSYILVDRACQGLGIGRRLFAAFEDEGVSKGFRQFGLDVFERSGPVVEWYQKRGYSVEHRMCHVVLSTAAGSRCGPALQCTHQEAIEADQEVARTGFARLRLSIDDRPMLVGLIGEDTCKLIQHEEATLENAVDAVRSFYRGRRNRLILSSVVAPPDTDGVLSVEWVLRMSKRVDRQGAENGR